MHLSSALFISLLIVCFLASVPQRYQHTSILRFTQPFHFAAAKFRTNSLFFHLATKKFRSSSNSCLCLNILLLLAGDIAINPGPSFGYTNIRSLKANSCAFNNFISSGNYNIVGLTETWIRPNDTSALIQDSTPPGYVFHHIPRKAGRGGGVGFFIKESINSSVINSSDLLFSTFEHITVSLDFIGKKVNFVSLYKPPKTSCIHFLDEFLTLVENLSAFPSPFVICGDFNLHIDNSDNKYTSQFLSLIESLDLTQHINFGTNLHNHIIDLLITPKTFNLFSNIHPQNAFSDHIFISADLNINSASEQNTKSVTFRRFHKINSEQLKHDLLSSPLITNPEVNSTDLYQQYHETLSALLDKHAPPHKKTLSNHKNSTTKWLNENILSARQSKRLAERRWRKNPTPVNRSIFRRQINYCNKIIADAKNKFYTNSINSVKENPKKLWKELNNILHRNPVSTLPDSNCSKSLADTFSSFFSDKISRIRASFPRINTLSTSNQHLNVPAFTTFKNITEEQLLKIIQSCPTKSCLLDPWPTFLVKEYIDILIKPITNMA